MNIIYKKKEFNKLLDLSTRFFNLDPCDELACKLKIKALSALNNKKEAVLQFKVHEKALRKTLNSDISPDMKYFREELLKKGKFKEL